MGVMRFFYLKGTGPLHGKIFYREDEYAIDFVCSSSEQLNLKAGTQGCISLLAHSLQLETSVETGALLYPWGFFPLVNVVDGSVEPPKAICGEVRVEFSGVQLVRGVSHEIPGTRDWTVIRDSGSGWVYIGPEIFVSDNQVFVEFASGSIIGIFEMGVSCLFIRLELTS